MANQDAILRYINEQLDSLCDRTEMWGPNLCVELQYLMLMEFWLVTARPDLEHQNPRLVLDEFSAFCKRSGHRASVPLANATRDLGEFQNLLRTFRDEFSKRITQMIPTILGHRLPHPQPSGSARRPQLDGTFPDTAAPDEVVVASTCQGGENRESAPHLKTSPRGLGAGSGQTRRTVNPVSEQVDEGTRPNCFGLAGSSPAPDTDCCDWGCSDCDDTTEWRRV